MKRTLWWAPPAVALWVVQPALADVIQAREGDFTIENKVTVQATAKTAYDQLGQVSDWWNSDHTWSGSAKNLTLDPHAGGCFCEKLADGGSVQHGRVIFAQPGVMLRLDSALGPLQEMPVTGVLTFKFAPGEKSGVTITMTYRVSGAFTLESAKLAPIVDQVLRDQLERLRAQVDSSRH
jgi:uncharacterized protein YndB with AHSA1/START domain